MLTESHTVLRADVTTPGPERLQVVWQTEDGAGSTPLEAQPATAHGWFLLDLAPLVDVAWRVLDDAGDEVCAGTTATANLPPGTPTFSSDVPNADVPPFWLATMTGLSGGHILSQIAMFRSDGTWIWAYAHPTVDEQIISADLSEAGVRFNVFDALRETDVASVDTVGFDGAAAGSRRTVLAHHFFAGLDGGAIAYQRADARVVSPHGCVVGDTLVEQAADGAERVIWSAWDHLPVTPGPIWDQGFYPGCKDWTHGSGLTWRASDDSLLLSLVGTQQVVHVSRASGETLAVFGQRGQYVPDSASPPFAIPHGARWTAAGELLVFDAHERPTSESGCYLYRIDEANHTLALEDRWVDAMHPGLYLGSVSELDDGRIQCAWGSDGFLRVFERGQPQPVYELHVNGLFQFGAVTPLTSLPGLAAN